MSFLRIAGNHLKRCALMHWSFLLLNDDTKYQSRGVNNRNTEAKKVRPKIVFFVFKNGWKLSQKMRLDVLIIFHIEWPHQVSSLVGKQSKYWSKTGKTEKHVFFKNGWKPSQKIRLGALIIFHIEWQHQVSSLVGKQSKYWSRKNEDQGHPKGIERTPN